MTCENVRGILFPSIFIIYITGNDVNTAHALVSPQNLLLKMQNTTTIIYVTHKYHMSCFWRYYGVYHIIKYEFIEKCDTFSTIILFAVLKKWCSTWIMKEISTIQKNLHRETTTKKSWIVVSKNKILHTFHWCLLSIDKCKYREYTNRNLLGEFQGYVFVQILLLAAFGLMQPALEYAVT